MGTVGAQTASGDAASLLQTPQTITIIPGQLSIDQGSRNLTEALRNVPGASFNAGGPGFATNTNNFSLRGFDASGAVFIDGVRDSGNYTRDLFSVEQVEVFKGASGDISRGNAGGYVNLRSKTPLLENFIAGSVGYGTDSYDSARKRATVDMNRVVGATTAVRLNVVAEDSGFAGRKFGTRETVGYAPAIAFGLGTSTTVELMYQQVREKGLPDFGVAAASVPGTINYNPTAGAAGRDTFYGLASDSDEFQSDAVTARVTHRLTPSLTLSNQAKWSQTERTALYTVPTGYLPATQQVSTQRQAFNRDNMNLINQTNLAARFDTGRFRHAMNVGLEFASEKSDGERYPVDGPLGIPGNVSVFSPDALRPVSAALVPSQAGEVKIDTMAAYLNDTVELGPQWQLTGGLRLERYKVRAVSWDATGAPPAPISGYTRSETSLGGKLGLVYKPARNGAVYVSYAQSGVPPGASWLSNPDASRVGPDGFPGLDGQNGRDTREQKLVHSEVGTKWAFLDDRLSTSAALFQTERKNVAMRQVGGVPSGYGEQSVKGLELGLAGAITPAFSIHGGLVLMDTQRRHGAAVDNALRGDYGGYLTTDGDQLAFAPKRSASLWATYRFPIGVTLGGGLQYVSGAWVGAPDTSDRIVPNGLNGRLPGYTVVNLMAAYDISRNIRLRLNVDNVTDEDYAQALDWDSTRAYLGAPRTVMVSADFRF